MAPWSKRANSVRMAPVTSRFDPIHTRSLSRPSPDLRALPEIVAWPLAPCTTTESIRPEAPRTTLVKRVTAPMAPVNGASFLVSAAAVNVLVHVRTGFADVKSPGSHTDRRYGSGVPPHASSLLAVTPPLEEW